MSLHNISDERTNITSEGVHFSLIITQHCYCTALALYLSAKTAALHTTFHHCCQFGDFIFFLLFFKYDIYATISYGIMTTCQTLSMLSSSCQKSSAQSKRGQGTSQGVLECLILGP